MSRVNQVAELRSRIAPFPDNPGGFYALIVPDNAAGRRHRYTVYRIPSSPSGRIRIMGMELPLRHARKIAKQIVAANRSDRS